MQLIHHAVTSTPYAQVPSSEAQISLLFVILLTIHARNGYYSTQNLHVLSPFVSLSRKFHRHALPEGLFLSRLPSLVKGPR